MVATRIGKSSVLKECTLPFKKSSTIDGGGCQWWDL